MKKLWLPNLNLLASIDKGIEPRSPKCEADALTNPVLPYEIQDLIARILGTYSFPPHIYTTRDSNLKIFTLVALENIIDLMR